MADRDPGGPVPDRQRILGIRLWSIALGVGQEQPAATPSPVAVPSRGAIAHRRPFPTEGPFPTEEPKHLRSLGGLFAQFLAGIAMAVIVLPPVIAVLWVVWTRLILEALVVHFEVEDDTWRTPVVDQTQPAW